MRRYVYADESGNFDFSGQEGASRYFILTTVTVDDHTIASDLQTLRRKLAWEGESLAKGFHATNDKQRIRDRVFDVLGRHDFRVDATILEKRKADPSRRIAGRFYGLAWYFHLSRVVPILAAQADELLVIAADIGANDMRANFSDTVSTVAGETGPKVAMVSAMWLAATHPLLQAADYCSWALHRKWERADSRSYNLIEDKIASELDVFR